MYQISQAYHSPNQGSREGAAITLLVLHATVGSASSAIGWMCNPASRVSSHYVIDKLGHIWQLVSDDRRASHAGVSAWQDVADCNDYSIGVELENDNSGNDPYPATQIDALKWLTQHLIANHPTIKSVASHAEVALPPGRKNDPKNFPLILFRAWVASLGSTPAPSSYTELSPLLAAPLATRAALRFKVPSASPYVQSEADDFLDEYYRVAKPVGLDPIVAIAQMIHETGRLTSWWCQRPRRNAAGIGVTGDTLEQATHPPGDWARNPDGLWHEGVSYKTWVLDSIPDHVGRLLAYAIPASEGTPLQQHLIQRSFARRFIPIEVRGSTQNIQQLGRVHNPSGFGWADPGDYYGRRIATIANSLIGN